MIEKIMKAVKSSNKKRSRNITIGAVVGFLLSCTAVMGAGDYLWIKGDKDGKIEFNTTATTDDDGSGGTWNTKNPYEDAGNIWDKDTATKTKTYINNITLSSSTANGKNNGNNISYGLRLSGDLGGVNFINNGLIIGIISVSSSSFSFSYGSGIYNSGTMGNIANTGVINGYGSSSSGFIYGYGIHNQASSKMGNIVNTGLISGDGSGGSSYGSGIYNDSSSEIKDITNTGVISGTGISISSGSYGHGIYNYSSTMENIENTGVISGTGSGTGYGYGIMNFNSSTMGNIENAGVISGTGISSGSSGYGYGIYNSGTMENIENTGVISGTGSGTGYGIMNYNSTKIGAITNTGVIYGKDNAIKNDGSGTIDTVNNYGILVTKGSSEVDGLTISNNYGLTIKNEGKSQGDITVEGSAAKDSVDIAMEYGENGQVIKSRSMTIENETGNNSFEGDKENHILNALTNTYKVIGENDKVTGSIINAYGTAVVFGDTGNNNQLTLSGTIVNGGIDEVDSKPGTKVAAILGSDDTDNGDTLILQSGKIKYKDGSEVTQNTVVNGNIDMGAGADTLTIGDGTIINGILDGGDSDSEDTLNFGISSGAKSNSSESEGVRILHNISNFENMNINTNVTLYEKTINASGEVENLKVTGAEKITIEENGTLTLRIDSTNKDNLSGKIIGHALYENEGEISSTDGGKLLLALNGAGNKEIISFGNTKLNTSLVTEYEGVYYEDVTFGTTSLIHSVKRVNDTENEVE
ncbi:MAG TPA: autotransporter domain-containing protein, partial [Fusobacterium sp.]|nr:autotransporter domain-containing protein [Fusobacterium sp.]